MLRLIYTIIMILALPVFLLRLLWKSVNFPAYRGRILERLGYFKNLRCNPDGFLIHAVSVGEVVLAETVINQLKVKYPNKSIVLTTTTPTGSQEVLKRFKGSVGHVYMPYDLPWMVNKLLRLVKPSAMIIMETEIWPNLIYACNKSNIPINIVNGRISDNSINRYLWIRGFMAKVLPRLTHVAAQSKIDGDRFLQLGLPKQKLTVLGNLKFDLQVNAEQINEGKKLKAQCADRIVFIAASTHPGEEEQILTAYLKIKEQFGNTLLILIPRHPQRFNEVAQLLTKQQVEYIRRTDNIVPTKDIDVLLGDTMGEMIMFYAMGDIAFVGGSLTPIGGHNLLEPAAVGLPTITGQYFANFKDITKCLVNANAVSIVKNATELAFEVISLLKSPTEMAKRGNNALEILQQNSGATQKLLALIDV